MIKIKKKINAHDTMVVDHLISSLFTHNIAALGMTLEVTKGSDLDKALSGFFNRCGIEPQRWLQCPPCNPRVVVADVCRFSFHAVILGKGLSLSQLSEVECTFEPLL